MPDRDTASPTDRHWLPFTPNRDFKEAPFCFASAHGNYFFTPAGDRVLDGSSALFTTPAGHGRAEIASAVHTQLLHLDYTSSFLRSHPGAGQVRHELSKLLPQELTHLFFTNSGSEAVDTALKLALQYHRVRKEASRSIMVSRERAYHGSNLSGVALSGLPNNRRAFGQPLLPVVHMRNTWLPQNRNVPGQGSYGAELADDLLRLIRLHGEENIAACIVEPIAGSTGTLVPPLGYLERLREICTEFGVLLIFDEVITGFGRTGQAFASQSFGVVPDMMTMAKAITNGAIPMGAVAVRGDLYEALCEAAPVGSVEFFHGYTGSMHPVACAASLATLGIYECDDLFARARGLSNYFLVRVFELASVRGVFDVRGYGFMAGVEIDPGVCGSDGYELQKRLFRNGVHVKTTGNSMVLAPPFTIEKAEIDQLVETTRRVLEEV